MIKNVRLSTRQKWQRVIKKYESRKIKGTEFFRKYKVSRSSLYKWRKYFKEELLGLDEGYKEQGGFIRLRVEQAEVDGSEVQMSQIKSAFRISKDCGLTIEFTNGCTVCELGKVIEVINAAQ